MSGDGAMVALQDLADFTSGGTPSKSNAGYWSGTIPWLSAKDMKSFRILDTEDHVSSEGAANGTRLAPEGAVLILTRGMTLLSDVPICVAQRPMTFNQDVKCLVAKPGVEPAYLAYALLAARRELLGMVDLAGHGTGRLPTDRLKALTVRRPSLAEQKRIAHVLGVVDDKIEINRRMNETLEALACALFRSWFVDFDPVRAKMEGRPPAGMDAETAALFPDGFEDSELGQVPRGWHVATLGDALELKRGFDLPQRLRKPGDVLVVSSSGLSGTHCLAKASAPGVVTGRYGTIGQVFFVASDFWPLNTTLWVSDFKRTPPDFVYRLLSTVDLEKFSDKAAVPGINRNHVHLEPIVLPPIELMAEFAKVAGSLRQLSEQRAVESSSLTELRDLLLPRLLSGELRVRDAEKYLEAVA